MSQNYDTRILYELTSTSELQDVGKSVETSQPNLIPAWPIVNIETPRTR